MMKQVIRLILPILFILASGGCSGKIGTNTVATDHQPRIDPDYTGITIPPGIAPMNFIIEEEGERFYAEFSVEGKKPFTVRSHGRLVKIPAGKWKKLIEGCEGKELKIEIISTDKSGISKKYADIINHIAAEPVDRYLTYRVIFPGYESWRELSIVQRDLYSFGTRTIIRSTVAEENCVNCHSFNNGRTSDFLFHMRGSRGGTFFSDGVTIEKYNLKTPEMKNGAVYPRWHPSGKYVAFSSNKIVQRFHSASAKRVEVSDLESSLVLYDREKNEMSAIPLAGSNVSMDTYPEWSPDGKTLYFCRAPQIGEQYDYRQIRYNLWKVVFNPLTGEFGKEELVYDAAAQGQSVSFPRISPDGRYIIVTIAGYGCFPVWHSEADLYLIDLQTGKVERAGLNSDFADSYHSWSSNGRWIVFASRRGNGSVTKPYIAYFDHEGKTGKPFELPQKDPEKSRLYLKCFNLPEFSIMKIALTPGKIRRSSGLNPIQAKWAAK